MAAPAILHIMQSSFLGGTTQAALRTMTYLHGLGAGFRITSPRPRAGAWPQLAAIDPVARAFPCRGVGLFGKFDPAQFAQFRRHVRELEAATEATWMSGSSVTALLASRMRRRRTVMSHHYYHFGDRDSWPRWKLFYELLCRQVDAVTYPTEFTRAEALRIAPWLKSRAVVVPNGYDVHYAGEAERLARRRAARDGLRLPADALIIGNGGWLNANKRFDVFLETAARIARRFPESLFVVCGGGPAEEQLRRRAAELGIAGRTRFTGWVTDMEPYYQAFDVLLFNSDRDTLPCTPMEAASHGCAVVASLLYGGLGEFLRDGGNGRFFDRHDPDRLAEAIGELAEDPALALRLREQAAADLRQRFSTAAGAAFYRDFFGV